MKNKDESVPVYRPKRSQRKPMKVMNVMLKGDAIDRKHAMRMKENIKAFSTGVIPKGIYKGRRKRGM